jgi:xanthine/uracil permease
MPCVLVTGLVVARLHHPGDGASQIVYLGKLFALTGALSVAQVLWGHRLPLIIGPATVLLVGIVASQAAGPSAIYTSVFLGGCAMAAFTTVGFFTRIRDFFTPRIVAVILILISFTLSPTILRLSTDHLGGGGAWGLVFALCLMLALVAINDRLPGAWKAVTLLLGIGLGTPAHILLFGYTAPAAFDAVGLSTVRPPLAFAVEPGTLLAFLFCFLALTINELGSIEAVGRILGAGSMDSRLRMGTRVCGFGNMASGTVGVIGSVDFSLSAGIIMATGCASRYPMVPMGILLSLCALFPKLIVVMAMIPNPVMGSILLYTMVSQLASGLTGITGPRGVTDFRTGNVVALPLMAGLLIAFTPVEAFAAFPAILRPVLGNGFVMGTLLVLALEHLVLRQGKGEAAAKAPTNEKP